MRSPASLFVISLGLIFGLLSTSTSTSTSTAWAGTSAKPNLEVDIGRAPFLPTEGCEERLKPLPRPDIREFEVRPHIEDDLEYLFELQRASTLGQLDSRFVKEWDTRVYYSATSLATKEGTLPIVNKDARATFLFFHGTGTAKANARNFSKKMNDLSWLGYFTAAVDLPYHGSGSLRDAFEDPDYFFNWLHDIIEAFRIPGKPMYLSGHSFGPHIIAEYARRYPNTVDGIVMFSPVAFDPVTKDWFENHTRRMKIPDFFPNSVGGMWARRIVDKFLWNARPNDPTTDISVLNPHLKVMVVSGDHEEFVPAPVGGRSGLPRGTNTYDVCTAVRAYIRRADCAILKASATKFSNTAMKTTMTRL